jgi:hypothetical protein
MDPEIRRTYEGAPSTVGSVFHYASRKVGEGRMTMAELVPNERVAVKAEFLAPMASTNAIEFTLTPGAGGVSLTWAMSGTNGFLAKAFSMFVDVDEMVGKDFERGLADLKRLSEEEAGRYATAAVPSA